MCMMLKTLKPTQKYFTFEGVIMFSIWVAKEALEKVVSGHKMKILFFCILYNFLCIKNVLKEKHMFQNFGHYVILFYQSFLIFQINDKIAKRRI